MYLQNLYINFLFIFNKMKFKIMLNYVFALKKYDKNLYNNLTYIIKI